MEEVNFQLKKIIVYIGIVFLLLGSLFSTQASANGNVVYVIPLHDAIDGALPTILSRAINEARMSNADLIILDINSPGGFVASAQDIRDILLASEIPIYAFVNNNAFSAAAFLALACERIYMTPAGSIGDAEVITADGQRAPEKIISAWDAQMRSLAELRGRDPKIASAMVRVEVEIPGLVTNQQLLTLTANQAIEVGYSEGIYVNLESLLESLGHGDSSVIWFYASWAERLARFLTHPQVASILLSVGMAALILEIFTAGFGVAGIVSIAAFTIFFGGHIVAGFANWEFIILFVIGLGLLVAEIFMAGFGLLGAGGVVMIFMSVIFTARTFSEGIVMLGWATIFTIILLLAFYKVLSKTKTWDRFVLKQQESINEGYVASSKHEELLGKEGITITHLRPAGTAEIDGKRYDVVSEGGYISSNEKIKVVKVGGNNIVVKIII